MRRLTLAIIATTLALGPALLLMTPEAGATATTSVSCSSSLQGSTSTCTVTTTGGATGTDSPGGSALNSGTFVTSSFTAISGLGGCSTGDNTTSLLDDHCTNSSTTTSFSFQIIVGTASTITANLDAGKTEFEGQTLISSTTTTTTTTSTTTTTTTSTTTTTTPPTTTTTTSGTTTTTNPLTTTTTTTSLTNKCNVHFVNGLLENPNTLNLSITCTALNMYGTSGSNQVLVTVLDDANQWTIPLTYCGTSSAIGACGGIIGGTNTPQTFTLDYSGYSGTESTCQSSFTGCTTGPAPTSTGQYWIIGAPYENYNNYLPWLVLTSGYSLTTQGSASQDNYNGETTQQGFSTNCTPTGETGFYSGVADGVNNYSYTYTWSGSPVELVADPNDTTGTVTAHGKTFATDADLVTSPSGGSTTFTVTPQKGTYPNYTNFYCWDGTAWFNWGNALAGGNGGGTTLTYNACSLISVTGPFTANGQEPPGTYVYNFTTKNPNSTWGVLVDPNDGNPTGTAQVAFEGTLYPGDSKIAIETAQSNTASLTVTTAGNPNNIKAYCWSDGTHQLYTWFIGNGTPPSGGVTITGNSNAANQGNNGGASNLQSCFDNISANFNWNLLNDAFQFAEGSAQLAICGLTWLFVPTSTQMSGLTTPLITSLNTHIPTSYLTDGVASITTINSALSSSIASGACTPFTFAPFTGTTTGAGKYLASLSITLPAPSDLGCGGTQSTTVGDLYGMRGWIRDIFQFAILLATALIIWKMTPWSRRGDAMHVIASFTNDEGATFYQTNEGSDNI